MAECGRTEQHGRKTELTIVIMTQDDEVNVWEVGVRWTHGWLHNSPVQAKHLFRLVSHRCQLHQDQVLALLQSLRCAIMTILHAQNGRVTCCCCDCSMMRDAVMQKGGQLHEQRK